VDQYSAVNLNASGILGTIATEPSLVHGLMNESETEPDSLSDEGDDETKKVAMSDESNDLKRPPGDIAVYRYYLKAAGIGRLAVFTLFVILNVFSGAFSSVSRITTFFCSFNICSRYLAKMVV
jgi:hypothetical protein